VTAYEQIKAWFDRDILPHPWIRVTAYRSLSEESGIRFSTRDFTYTIFADDATPGARSYLGCTFMVNGKRLAGDLPDGELSKETWREILIAITENEVEHQMKQEGGRSR
jgi:hypothetical protein